MRKSRFILLVSILGMVGCQKQPPVSSSSPSLPTSSSPVVDRMNMPHTVQELAEFINHEGKEKWIQNEQGATIFQEEGTHYSYSESTEVVLNRKQITQYSGDYALLSLQYDKINRSWNEEDQDVLLQSYTGKGYIGKYEERVIHGNVWDDLSAYEVDSFIQTYYITEEQTDYENGVINEQDVLSFCSTYSFANTAVFASFKTCIDSNTASFFLDHEVGGEYQYTILHSTKNGDRLDAYETSQFVFTFDQAGFLADISFEKRCYAYDYGREDFYELSYTIWNIESKKGSREEPVYPLLFQPQDYLVQDVTLQLESWGEVLDVTDIKIGKTLEVRAVDPLPSTALDLDFSIVSSSNEDVVAQQSDHWDAIGAGKTMLTIMNSTGYTQTIEVQVTAPDLTMILLSLQDENRLYVGQTYTLSIMKVPNAAVDTFEVIVANPSIASLEKIDDLTYSLHCLAVGTTSIVVTSTIHPEISKSLEIEIKEPLTEGGLREILCEGEYQVYCYYPFYDTLVISFEQNGMGSIRVGTDSATFQWTMEGESLTLTRFTLQGVEYIDNTISILDEGQSLSVNFSDGYYNTIMETLTK